MQVALILHAHHSVAVLAVFHLAVRMARVADTVADRVLEVGEGVAAAEHAAEASAYSARQKQKFQNL